MPQPTRGDVHVNRPLTQISVAHIQDADNFISDRFFPTVPVDKQSDRYFVYDRGDFNRDDMEERAPGTESSGGGYDVDNTPTYYCRDYSYHKDIPDPIRDNEDSPLSSDRDATIFVTNKGMIRRERAFATAALASGVWSNEETGVTANPGTGEFLQWADSASDPVGKIRTAKRQVLEATGFEPNKLALGQAVFDALVDHPDIVDRVKYGQSSGNTAVVNEASLAALFGLRQVLVSKAVYNAAAKGATESSTFISGANALLAYVTPTPGILVPTAGYTFAWRGRYGAAAMGHRIKRFRLEREESDRIEIQMAFQHKVIGADLGFFFENAADFQVGASS